MFFNTPSIHTEKKQYLTHIVGEYICDIISCYFYIIFLHFRLKMAANISNIKNIIPRLNANILVQNCVARRCFASSVGASDAPYSSNDEIAPRIRNRNPMNLEMMQLGKNSNMNNVQTSIILKINSPY